MIVVMVGRGWGTGLLKFSVYEGGGVPYVFLRAEVEGSCIFKPAPDRD